MTSPFPLNHSGLPECDLPPLRSVSPEIIGIKLEPIVALSSSRVVGREVLSLLASPEQSEAFFQQQSVKQSLRLLELQLAMLKNTLYAKNLFINLPITVLSDPESFARILPLLNAAHLRRDASSHLYSAGMAEKTRYAAPQRLTSGDLCHFGGWCFADPLQYVS